MFVDEIIEQNAIMKWKINDKILIKAPTGSGKSHFMLHILARYYNSVNRKVLIFSNRSLLREQNKERAEENVDCINYQYFEKMTKKKMEKMLASYDVLCFDECHYFFSDSSFNDTTDNVLRYALKDTNQLKIFASATPEPLYKTGAKFNQEYNIEENFDFIEELVFYDKTEKALEEIMNQEKKAVCFFSNATKAISFKETNKEEIAFICSKGNPLYRFRDKDELDNIITKNRFEKKVLATTTVLDNGVSLIDDELKIVLIDLIDPIAIIQTLGRKRLRKGEKIKVYIRVPNKRELYYKTLKIKKKSDAFTRRCYGEFISDYNKLIKKLGFVGYWISRFKIDTEKVRLAKDEVEEVKNFLELHAEEEVSKEELTKILGLAQSAKLKTVNAKIHSIDSRFEIISKKVCKKNKVSREWFIKTR
jgi:superfamily II DNA or RNA helicase